MIDYVRSEHLPKILANNEQYVHWLAPLNMTELSALIAKASYVRQMSAGDAFLVGFTSDSSHDHENLKWLRARFDSFVYIDRVIVGETAQGKGYGRALYADFEAFAREKGILRMVCEVNTMPDNPGSHTFHLKLGFKPCGDKDMDGGRKRVRYYEKSL